jgi:hypothetical protein
VHPLYLEVGTCEKCTLSRPLKLALVAAFQARLKKLARGNVKELEVSSADVGVVEGRLDVILESLHRLRGTLKQREEAKIRNKEQQELAKQWEEIQKAQRQAEQ